MKKVIEISGDHGFKKGVITYIHDCDINFGHNPTHPNIKLAFDFSPCADDYIFKVLYHTKQSFPKAHVRLIQIDYIHTN